MINAKTIEPEYFSDVASRGKGVSFRDWAYGVKEYVNAFNPNLKEAMDRTELDTIPLPRARLAELGVEEVWDRRLRTLLIARTKDHARQIVRSADREPGLEMWRLLVEQFDPSTEGRELAEVQGLLHPGQAKSLEVLHAHLIRWENALQREENRTGAATTLPEKWRKAVLLTMLPDQERKEIEAQKHLFKNYHALRNRVTELIHDRTGGSSDMIMPLDIHTGDSDEHYVEDPETGEMELYRLEAREGKKVWVKKGKGKGKGKGGGNVQCYACGRKGHIRRDCKATHHMDGGDLHPIPGTVGRRQGKDAGTLEPEDIEQGMLEVDLAALETDDGWQESDPWSGWSADVRGQTAAPAKGLFQDCESVLDMINKIAAPRPQQKKSTPEAPPGLAPTTEVTGHVRGQEFGLELKVDIPWAALPRPAEASRSWYQASGSSQAASEQGGSGHFRIDTASLASDQDVKPGTPAEPPGRDSPIKLDKGSGSSISSIERDADLHPEFITWQDIARYAAAAGHSGADSGDEEPELSSSTVLYPGEEIDYNGEIDLNAVTAPGPNDSVPEKKGFRRLPFDLTLDSGAGASVMDGECVPEYARRESQGSQKGVRYVGAGGERIPNRGEKALRLMYEDGRAGQTVMQDAKVRKPLLAVSDVCRKGNVVVFSTEGSFIAPLRDPVVKAWMRGARNIDHKVKVYEEHGVYKIPAWIVPPICSPSEPSSLESSRNPLARRPPASGFTRQGA